MSFGDWNLFIGGSVLGTGSITPLAVSPIADDQSVEIDLDTSGGPTTNAAGNLTRKDDSALLKGVTQGRLRTLIRRDNGTTSSVIYGGIAAMQSMEDITSSGSAYYTAIAENGDILLRRISSGLTAVGAVTGTALASGETITFTVGTVVAFEFMWFYDPIEFNGTRLQVFAGDAFDSVPLPLIYDVVDPIGTALTTSVAEGIFATLNTGNTPSRKWVFDNTDLFFVELEP